MAKLEIFTNKEFSVDFTVVSDDGSTGEPLDPSDTASFTLSTRGQNPKVSLGNIPLTIVDALNGIFNLTLTASQTSGLIQDIGFKEDKYNTLSNYAGFIDFILVSGNRQAKLDIFIVNTGI